MGGWVGKRTYGVLGVEICVVFPCVGDDALEFFS